MNEHPKRKRNKPESDESTAEAKIGVVAPASIAEPEDEKQPVTFERVPKPIPPKPTIPKYKLVLYNSQGLIDSKLSMVTLREIHNTHYNIIKPLLHMQSYKTLEESYERYSIHASAARLDNPLSLDNFQIELEHLVNLQIIDKIST